VQYVAARIIDTGEQDGVYCLGSCGREMSLFSARPDVAENCGV
jgi:predicted metal-binding membrane protein